MSQGVKRNLARAFVVFATLAVALNVYAAAASFQAGRWGLGSGYFLIAAGLSVPLVIQWYASHRQTPYRWRDMAAIEEREERYVDPWDAWDAEFDDDDWRDRRWRDDDE